MYLSSSPFIPFKEQGINVLNFANLKMSKFVDSYFTDQMLIGKYRQIKNIGKLTGFTVVANLHLMNMSAT